jgi:DNA polymerase III subunit delta
MAETKILTHDHTNRFELADEYPLCEFSRAVLGKRLVERLDDDANGRNGLVNELNLSFERGEERRRRSPKNDGRRWVERQRHGNDTGELGLTLGARQYFDVPAVDSIEVADRAERRSGERRGFYGAIQGASFCYFPVRGASWPNFGYEKLVTPEEAIAETKTGKTRPVYVLAGEEPYAIESVLTSIREVVLTGALAHFNEEKLLAGEVSVDRVLSAARMVPMMAKQKLVIVRSLERWETRSPEGEEEELEPDRVSPLDRLADYAAAPVPSTCLVLVANKIDGRRKLMTAARKGGWLVTCDPLARGALPGFVAREVASRGHAIEPPIADLLAEIAGPELSSVADAIERLSLYVGPERPITEDAIATCLVRMRLSTVWELINAVGRRELGVSLHALDDVYDPRDRGIRLVALLAWSLRQLIKFDAAIAAGFPPEEAARRAGAPPFKARDLVAQVRRLSRGELERWLLLLAGADLELKGSKRPARATVEDAIMQMCRRPVTAN